MTKALKTEFSTIIRFINVVTKRPVAPSFFWKWLLEGLGIHELGMSKEMQDAYIWCFNFTNNFTEGRKLFQLKKPQWKQDASS